MKIAIAGAGMAGSYMYRLLKEQGFDDVDLYDVKRCTRCGRRPCAWGASPSEEYRRLVSRFVEPEDYILHRSEEIAIDGVKMPADVVTLDKPGLLEGLIDGASVSLSPIRMEEYDRVIDATGVERAYLGPVQGNDFVANCIQYRVRQPKDMGLWFRMSSIGYEWCFPLGDGEYHIGFGNLKTPTVGYRPSVTIEALEKSTRCRCLSRLRLSSPLHSQPFVAGKVIGVGESVGAVGPLAGDGNLYAMQTSEMLMKNWDDPEKYTGNVLKEFKWMTKERRALERLLNGRMPTLSNVLTFKQHSKRAGIDISISHLVSLFRKMLEI